MTLNSKSGKRAAHAATLLVSCVLLLFTGSQASAAPLLLDEGFDNVGSLSGSGWDFINLSNPIGTTGWFQGNPAPFTAETGAADSYIAANFLNTDSGNISDWLLTPELALDNGVGLTFSTRTEAGSVFPDRLEVRLSTNAGSANVGTTDTSVGDFTTLLLSLNPALAVDGYPTDWATYSLSLTGLSGPVQGRLAFRYFVEDTSVNANYIGIDSVKVAAAVPEPGTLVSVVMGLLCIVIAQRRRRFSLS